MPPLRRLTLSEYTAQRLRADFQAGRWSGTLPGVARLAQEFGVSRDSMRAALRALETEGLLAHSGAGKSRLITPHDGREQRKLRVGILLPSSLEKDNAHTHELIFSLRHAIEAAGHACFLAPKTTALFHHRPERVRRYMDECPADAWVLYSARREVLEMAGAFSRPVFALGGEAAGLPLAGSRADLTQPIRDCLDLLVAQRHRSIVLICPDKWRHPRPNASAQAFLDALQAHGLPADPHFNLPDWEHTPAGLDALLCALFYATPPSALLVMEPECLGPTLVFLAAYGRRVPIDISVVNILPDPMQAFYRPAIAHFQWPVQPHVKRTMQWLQSVVRGQPQHRTSTVEPIFVRAESIGPVAW